MRLGAEFLPTQQVAFGHDADDGSAIDHRDSAEVVLAQQSSDIRHTYIHAHRDHVSGHDALGANRCALGYRIGMRLLRNTAVSVRSLGCRIHVNLPRFQRLAPCRASDGVIDG
jgi:hypothetical protein